jgi:hypothetical protein
MMIGMIIAHGLLAFSVLAIAVAAPAQEPDAPTVPVSESTAKLIGIYPEVTELHKLSSANPPADRWEVLWLHQRIYEQVTSQSLQLDATISRIDNEITHASELRSYLSDRRDEVVNRADLLGIIVGGGAGAAGSSMQFSSDHIAKIGNAFSLGGGVLTVGLGLLGLHAQSGKAIRFDFDSNMLAEFFDRPIQPDSHYSEIIWTFLNQPSLNDPTGPTRKQQLLQTWVRVRRIESLDDAAKIERLTSEPTDVIKLSIDDLEDRVAMLEDVRARISVLKRDLGYLLGSLPDAPQLSSPDFKPGP